jgi:hypothetical protein
MAANACHLDRPRGSEAGVPATLGFRVVGWEATEGEWRDPENAYPTRLMQGVSTWTLSLKLSVPAEEAPSGFLDYASARNDRVPVR